MRSVNKVILLGRLGAKPELRTTSGGKSWCKVSLATSRPHKKNDVWIEETDWHNLVLWNKEAENFCHYMEKGSPCCVEGRLSCSSYDDSNGIRRRSVDVIVERAIFLPNGDRTGARPAHREQRPPSSANGEQRYLGPDSQEARAALINPGQYEDGSGTVPGHVDL